METSKVNHLTAAESSGSILEHPSLNCRGNLALEDLPPRESGVGWSGESLIALNQGWDASSLHLEHTEKRKSIEDLRLPPISPILALTPSYPLLSLVLT